MRIWLLTVAVGCALAAAVTHAAAKGEELVYVGTHGAGGGPQAAPTPGAIHGIYRSTLDVATGHLAPFSLVAELQRATWLVVHPKLPVLYSVAQGAGGMDADSDIYSYTIDPKSGALQPQAKTGAGGHDATHLDLNVATQSLFSANYGSGSLTVLSLGADGRPGAVAATQVEHGNGPLPRQKSPHAHGVAVAPDARFVLTADMGADRVFVYRFDRATRALQPAATPEIEFSPGAGPRHLTFHPTRPILYVNTELSGELRSFSWDGAGNLTALQSLSVYPEDFRGEKSGGEIKVAANGKTLYASLRGALDALIVYSIDARGRLTEIQRMPSGGQVPWSFGIDPSGRWMLVTNETSNTVNVFQVDAATGTLRATDESQAVPKPVTVAFYKR